MTLAGFTTKATLSCDALRRALYTLSANNAFWDNEMTPSDGESQAPIERARKPYVAPRVIFSELFAAGVGAKLHFPTPEYHSGSSTSTS
jgi:hypothetical protein